MHSWAFLKSTVHFEHESTTFICATLGINSDDVLPFFSAFKGPPRSLQLY